MEEGQRLFSRNFSFNVNDLGTVLVTPTPGQSVRPTQQVLLLDSVHFSMATCQAPATYKVLKRQSHTP